MHERERLESAAATHAYLRGLLFVPMGAILMLSALANEEVGPFAHAWAFPVAFLAVGAACLPIMRHYQRHYGRAGLSARAQVKAGAALALTPLVMIAGSLLLRSRADWSLDLPVNAIAVSFALVMLVSYALGAGLRAHHVAIAGVLLLAGGLPVWDGQDPSNTGLVMAGAAIAVSGILDHRLFVRTFGAPGALGHDA
jgi:hypothetical protein